MYLYSLINLSGDLIQIKTSVDQTCERRRMKAIWSHIGVMLLCFCVTLYGAASNAAMSMGPGLTVMVICSDDGAKTITLDATGAPISPASQCCDCLSCIAPSAADMNAVFEVQPAPSHFSKLALSDTHQNPAPTLISRPQARGPPPANLNGVRTAPGCGLVFKDTIV